MPRVFLMVLTLTASCASPRSGLDGPADAAAVDGSPADGRAPGEASCAGDAAGTSACGAHGESCCTSPPVPSTTYFRTYASDGGSSPSGEADPATVSGLPPGQLPGDGRALSAVRRRDRGGMDSTARVWQAPPPERRPWARRQQRAWIRARMERRRHDQSGDDDGRCGVRASAAIPPSGPGPTSPARTRPCR